MPHYHLPIDNYSSVLTLDEHNKLIDILLETESFFDD